MPEMGSDLSAGVIYGHKTESTLKVALGDRMLLLHRTHFTEDASRAYNLQNIR